MTTDARRWAAGAALALAGWLGVMTGGAFVPAAAPALLIVAPPPDILHRLPGAMLVDAGRFTVTLTGVTAAEAYGAGGMLVLPAGLRGCVALL